MKELVVLSGKGGTGKTAVTAAFAHLASADEMCPQTVIADADVDAANLALVVGAASAEGTEFIGGEVASIDQESCLVCGICQECCRFDAISFSPTDGFLGRIPFDESVTKAMVAGSPVTDWCPEAVGDHGPARTAMPYILWRQCARPGTLAPCAPDLGN